MAATPPMRLTVPTPPSPLHGGRYDTYHATRKSTRQHTTRTTRAVNTPPPPPSEDLLHRPQSSSHKKSSKNPAPQHFDSPPSSTHTSPRKKAKKNNPPKMDSTMNGEDSSRAPSEDPFYNPAHNPTFQQPSLNFGVGMLPTPVKTPRKKPTDQASLNAAGRVLFPDRAEDPMPPSRKNRKGKRHVGFSLYSSMEDENKGGEDEIPIFTDSKDKVPELDPSEDNPFLDKPDEAAPQPEPSKGRGSRKREAVFGLDGSKEIENAFNREEGMVYVFRGKKVYRKFPDESPEADDEEGSASASGDISTSTAQPRTLTRSSVKPRLLFPTATQKAQRTKSDIEAEEAMTDIDDLNATETDHEQPIEKRTPVKATFRGLAPDTPPDTGHATRSATKKAAKDGSSSPAISPVKLNFNKKLDFNKPKGKRVSPFDGWARIKPSKPTTVKGKKRSADAMEDQDETVSEADAGSKRAKTSGV